MIPAAKPIIGDEEREAVDRVLRSGMIAGGPEVKAFEEAFLREMDLKLPEVMAEFKKGNLPEDGLAKMTKLAQDLIPQYK